jgi:hypothetical protein
MILHGEYYSRGRTQEIDHGREEFDVKAGTLMNKRMGIEHIYFDTRQPITHSIY